MTKFDFQMIHILESLVQSEKYAYLRLDGTTPMTQRQETIHLFNRVCMLIKTVHITIDLLIFLL